ncbi:MAG: hypothetical protein RL141_1008 [Candidatus Parcubacteria bacterium]|jgi:hypothetical protein
MAYIGISRSERIEIPRQKNRSLTQLQVDHLTRAKELTAWIDHPGLHQAQREWLVARITYLLFLAGKTWHHVGITPRKIRKRLEGDILKEATRLLEQLRQDLHNYEHRGWASDRYARTAYIIRLHLARAHRQPIAIGTTHRELEMLANGSPSWEYATQRINDFRKNGDKDHNLLIHVLRNPQWYPPKRIQTTQKELRTLAFRAVRSLLQEIKKIRAQKQETGEESAYAWMDDGDRRVREALQNRVSQIYAYGKLLQMSLEDMGTSKEQITELLYPRALYREKALKAIALMREQEEKYLSKRDTTRVRSYCRRARCSLKELGTGWAELRAIEEKIKEKS